MGKCLTSKNKVSLEQLTNPFGRSLFLTFGLLILGVISANAGTFSVFGPKTYVRKTEQPITVTDKFTVVNPSGPYTLRVTSGRTTGGEHGPGDRDDERRADDRDGERRDNDDRQGGISKTVIFINGVRVVDQDDFRDKVTVLNIPVKLSTSNQISVEVLGKKGGTITVQIWGVDNEPPTIKATVSPTPNAAGWNNTNATVTFTCSDAISGIASCPPPQTVTTEGANQIISGTATDNAGNKATTSITLNIDKTPPSLSITSPANGATVSTSAITVTGSVSDSLSGVSTVSCNGVAANLQSGSFNCPLTLNIGANNISVQAADIAGNTTPQTETVTLTPPAVLTQVNPNTGHQGRQALLVTITAQFTHFVQGTTTATFGTGVTVTSLTVNSATSATAVLNIDPAAATGVRTVTLSTGSETASFNNGFTVLGGQLTLLVQPPVSPTFQSSQVVNGSVANETGQTMVTIAGGASAANQNLPAAQTQFGVSVPLQPNTENLLNVTATDASGQTATASNLKIVQLTLSNLVKAQVTAQRLTTPQIQALVANGTINLNNPANYNVSMFTVSLYTGGTGATQTVTVTLPVAGPIDQNLMVGPPLTLKCGTPTQDIEVNGNQLVVPCGSGSSGPWNIGIPQYVILPFEVSDQSTGASIPGLLLFDGKIKTLKEFFNVNLMLMNLSSNFTLSGITAKIAIADQGLSPVVPASGTIAMNDLPANSQGSGQFVIRGDVIGTHTVTVNFGGMIEGASLTSPVPISGSATTDVQVAGPPTLNVTVEQPATVTAGVPYTLKVNIQNTSTDLDALYASLELDLSGASLIDPTTGMPAAAPNILSLGNILEGQTVSETYTVVPQSSGPIASCVGGASQNITLSVVFTNTTQSCAIGTIPSQVVSASGQPTVVVLPAPNTPNVPVTAAIDLIFSDAIQTPTVTAGAAGATFTLYDPSGAVVPGSLAFTTLSNGATLAAFQPSTPLQGNSVYRIVVSPSIFDLNGAQLASGITSSFTTAPPPPTDTIPPQISIEVPPPSNPGSVPQGQLLKVLVNASDNSGTVARIDLLLDGQLVDSVAQPSSVILMLDTSTLVPGSTHTITAVATDPSGNTSSAAVNITIAADTVPPTVSISSAATVLQGQALAVSIQAADNVGVAQVNLFLDGGNAPVFTGYIAPYQASLDTTQLSNGAHQLVAVATDGAGNVAQATQAFLVRSIASIAVSPGTITLNGTGSTQSLMVTATLTDASTTPILSGVAFSSSNTTVAAVDSSGVVTSVTPGTATITAIFGSLPPAQATVTDIASVPATLALASGNNQTGIVGQQLAAPLSVKATDANSRPVPNVAVTFSVLAGGGTVAQSTVVTDSQGLGSTTLKLGQTPGANSATATAGTLAGSPVTFVATGILPTPGLSPTATSELFNLSNLNWSPLSAMSIPRAGTTLTVLGDGTVLVLGGVDSAANMFSSVVSGELFTPATGTWTRTVSLMAPRAFHTQTLLPDGSVLITGGLDASGIPVATTEVYRGPPVQKATPILTWPTPAAIAHATPLGAGQLNATANVPGSFTYTPPAGTLLIVGSQTLSVTFVPTDTVHYTNATATVTLAVTP
jgi:Glucodextranase, domain B/Bacterial Ig-like domain/Bacterial Ig domain/Bacterial Ig-like domain (group 2)